MESLEQHLIEEVKSYGELYRIKNTHDTLILFSRNIVKRFRNFSTVMEKKRCAFETNVKRFSYVATRIRHQHIQKSQISLERYFVSKRSVVRGVVDELFDAGKDESKREKILSRFMPESQVLEKIDESQTEIRNHLEKEIADFFLSFSQELQTIAVEAQKLRIGQAVDCDLKFISELGGKADTLRGLGVAGGVASGLVFAAAATAYFGAAGTIFGVGAANIWNPVGRGLMGVGAILTVAGGIEAKEQKEKQKKAKENAIVELTSYVSGVEGNIKEGLANWVDCVLAKFQADHIDVMGQYAQYAEKHLGELASVTTFLDTLNSKMQIAKYQSMIRRFQRDASLVVTDVAETDGKIAIHIYGDNSSRSQTLEKVISRIEEKSVSITRRPKCHN